MNYVFLFLSMSLATYLALVILTILANVPLKWTEPIQCATFIGAIVTVIAFICRSFL
jgi:putative flippase GtrA